MITILKRSFSGFILLLVSTITFAQIPVLKVDLNFSGRNESEVHEPGYTSWILSGLRKKTYEGVTFQFKNGILGESWYKTGVQSPNYARLVNDGLYTTGCDLEITGLQAGEHSLVTFHNNFDNPENNTFKPLDIYFNGELAYDNLVTTTRIPSNDGATTVFFKFTVAEDDTVTIRFEADPTTEASADKITICGFHLNSSDPKKMASYQYPADLDEHVNIDNDTLISYWKAPENAIAHNVYMGTDEMAVRIAKPGSPEFIGTLTDTFFIKTGFYSMDKYYWRVDPVTNVDTTKGDVWYFKKRIHAFPGAEGYGGYAIGGRGGKVVYVTNLDDSGPGSFRDAVENQEGPRTILFNVSGIITLKSRLVISDDYVTVAGQSAPGKGICFRWAPLGVTGDNLIVQNLRVRLGIGITSDGMGLTGSQYSIIDHCSISWTIDEGFSSRGAKNITLQRVLISEPLNAAGHKNYPYGTKHGYAGSIGGDVGSFHLNLLAHCYGRNWSMAGGLDGDSYYAGRLDLFNNVCYNWGDRATDGGAHEVNFVGNYYKKGASTNQSTILKADLEGTGSGSQSYYTKNNIVENTNGSFSCNGTNDACSRKYTTSNGQVVDWQVFVNEPFFESEAKILSAKDAYKHVLSDVGCTQPAMDDHDIRMVDETLNRTYTIRGSYTHKAGFPDHEKDAGYWEVYPGFNRDVNWDTDLDGLPNWWEIAHGMDTNSATNDYSETNADTDRNGYTNLEEYLQWMGKPHYFITTEDSLVINLSTFTKGFTAAPEHRISDVENGLASLKGDSLAIFKPVANGMGGFDFTVTDSTGSSLTQSIGVFIGKTTTDSLFTYSYLRDRSGTRLVTVDSVNTVTEIVEVENYLEELSSISIYPNPTTQFAQLSFDASMSSETNISIFNAMGQKVYASAINTITGNNTIELDLTTFRTGVYVVVLSTNNSINTTRFIKQ